MGYQYAALLDLDGVIIDTRAATSEALPFLLPPVVADLVDVVIAHEDAPPKPAPDGVLTACARLGVQPAHALFLGDTVNDIAAGRSAGVLTVGAGWGFVGSDTLRRAGADVVLVEPHQVGVNVLRHLDGRRVPEQITD